MEFFPLLELPEEIQAVVVERAARFTISSMFYPFLGDSICLLRLSLMKRAADAGYERAVYTYAMTRAIFEGEGKYFDGIPFEYVDRIGKLVRSVKWGWGLWHGDYFRDHKVLFICFFMSSFYRCQCANLVQRQCHCLWHIDVTKDDNMCNRCFWIKELGLFVRDFEPISLLRDTRKW
ncbi:hypothetical protein YC2023_049497 [Brassica napus]